MNETIDKKLNNVWDELVEKNGPVTEKRIDFYERYLIIPELSGRIAKFTFDDLCNDSHSVYDYLELVKHIDVLFVTGIPRMNLDMRDQARRFIVLLDSLYENQKVLIASMYAPVEELLYEKSVKKGRSSSKTYAGDEEVFAFDRAISRLKEMQSTEWLGPEPCQVLARLETSK